MRVAGRSKLFHAIVGLGLAAAGCGGRETTQGQVEDAQVGEGASSQDTGVDAPDDTMAGLIFTLPEAGIDAAAVVAADAAADVAADVASEPWHPIPIA
jgi:hypothetical protein